MKSYREIADSVFERRERYIAAQQRKRKHTVSAITSICSCALVALVGASVWRSGVLTEDPPLSDSLSTTTVTHSPVTEGTAVGTAPSASHSGIVSHTTPTTSVFAPSQTTPSKTQPPTVTSTPSKTEPVKTTVPTKTTTPTVPGKVVITGEDPDTGMLNQEVLSKNKKYITKCLQQMMETYEGVDVKYAVIVTIPAMNEDMGDDFWNSTEELVRFCKEYDEVYRAYDEEFMQLNPTFSGGNVNGKDIVWSDTLRDKYERWLALIEKRDRLVEQYMGLYVESVLNQRFDALKILCDAEPVDVLCEYVGRFDFYYHGYYVELAADVINALAEQGGYMFRLAAGDTWYQEICDA